MAFQVGTQVRPELGRADVSGFARAGMITGQALANLGQDIGEGIEKYKKNKQITTVALSELEGRISSDPSILTAMEEAAKDNPTIGKSLKNLNEGTYKQSDLLSLGGFASAYQNQKRAAQESRIRAAELAKLTAGPTEAETAKAAAELAETKAKTAKIEAETAAIGKPKPLTPAQRMSLIESKVGDVTFGEYLQELMQTKAIKGGELHQRGLFNFDEEQIAAFDDAIMQNPEFLKNMPQAVKDYYIKLSGSASEITLPDGTVVRVTPQ